MPLFTQPLMLSSYLTFPCSNYLLLQRKYVRTGAWERIGWAVQQDMKIYHIFAFHIDVTWKSDII